MDKKATSAYTRSLISVYDARPSAVAIGGVGIGMLCLVGLILLLPDLINIFRYCCESSEKDWLHGIFGLYSRVCHFFFFEKYSSVWICRALLNILLTELQSLSLTTTTYTCNFFISAFNVPGLGYFFRMIYNTF